MSDHVSLMSGITNSSVEVASWGDGYMDLLDLKNSSEGLGGGGRCRLEHGTRVQSLPTSLEFHSTSVASRIPILAASSRPSWGSRQHYLHRVGTCEHLDMEDESLTSLLLLLSPSLEQ
jgi:hypothetical protein